MAVPKAKEPPTHLSVGLLDRLGQPVARWGRDEQAVGDIPRNLSFSTSDPGGFKDSNLVLSRPITVERATPDMHLLRDVWIYGAGERTAWEGLLQETPQHHAEEATVSPGAVGHITELDFDPSFREVYVGRDLGEWQPNSSARKQALLKGLLNIADGSVEADPTTGLPALRLSATGAWPNGFLAEMQFDAGPGAQIAAITWERAVASNFGAAEPSAVFQFIVASATDDVWSVAESNADTHTAGGDTDPPSTFTPVVARRWMHMIWYYVGANPTTSYVGDSYVRRIAVFGNHGLTKRGEAPDQGYYGCDVVADIVGRTAPRLNYTTGPDGSIQDSTFVIPHLVFRSITKGSDAILGVNAYHQRFFGVYDNKTFFWLPTTTFRKRWRIRRSAGHGIDLLGPQADDAYNGVVGVFNDVSGRQVIVGPTGCTTADVTSDLLLDEDPTNPVNAAGIDRKWGEVQLGFVTNTTGAIQVCRAWMDMKRQSANSRGSVSVSGCVQDDATGVYYPAWCMRAGDSAIVTDGDNIERRIIETRYEHESRTATCHMDATPHKVEALMERMGVVLVGYVD